MIAGYDVSEGTGSTLGTSSTFRDPLWRVTVRLTPLEQALLRTWWVRRLGFITHAGAAAISSTQTYSRLEHSLGLLALVAHFDPDDRVTRVAALLHDVGHLPFSHTFEGVLGLNHHDVGTERIRSLAPILSSHGVDMTAVIEVLDGRRPSALDGSAGALRLDHLESFVRSGRAHGRTLEPPSATLARLSLVDGAVSTDAATAGYLRELVLGEARLHSSGENIAAIGVIRHLATQVLSDADAARVAEVAAMTDHEFWALLLSDPRTLSLADAFRRDPVAWEVIPLDSDDGTLEVDAIRYELTRLYLDLPLIDGHPMSGTASLLAGLPRTPWRWVIRRRGMTAS